MLETKFVSETFEIVLVGISLDNLYHISTQLRGLKDFVTNISKLSVTLCHKHYCMKANSHFRNRRHVGTGKNRHRRNDDSLPRYSFKIHKDAMDENGKAGVSARSFLNIQKEDKKMIRSLSQAGGRRYIQLKKMVSSPNHRSLGLFWPAAVSHSRIFTPPTQCWIFLRSFNFFSYRWIICFKMLMVHHQQWNSSLVMDVGVLLMERILCWLREASPLTLSTGKSS